MIICGLAVFLCFFICLSITAAINNLRIETRKKSSGFLGTGIGGKSQKTENLIDWARNQGLGELFDERGFIDKELAEIILEKYGDKLVGQTKETLEALIPLLYMEIHLHLALLVLNIFHLKHHVLFLFYLVNHIFLFHLQKIVESYSEA